MPNNVTTEIDWIALDEFWEKQYTEDYGKLFGKKVVISEYP
jgi:hypothetical protein